ncbi:glycoside hydrolase family 2 TIM barrel-domain containing protein [Hymenobacter tenuis]
MLFRYSSILFWLLSSGLLSSCRETATNSSAKAAATPPPGVVPVKIVQTSKGYQLLRGGKPYIIKGAAGLQQIERIKELGGNSLRLYTTNYADAILDKAQQQGLTVMLGVWMKPEYEDFDYFDRKAVQQQQQEIREQVLRYRNHPALLMWNVGNELDNHTSNPRAFQALNEVARMIHELDPYHPVTTTLTSNFNMVSAVVNFCPDLDVLTVNIFGGLDKLKEKLRKDNWTGPYIVGEFGARGWWEAPKTAWKAPLDQSSQVKAEYMRTRFEKSVRGEPDYCLGAYILYWGQRFEQTDMWFSLFNTNGEKTAMVDMVHYLWTGKSMPNQAPRLTMLRLAGLAPRLSTSVRPGASYLATVRAHDPEGDPLRLEWQVVPDVDENFVLPQNRTGTEPLKGAILSAKGEQALIKAPAKKGPYRLLVTAYDGRGSIATHSYPFYVGTFTKEDLEMLKEGSFKKKSALVHTSAAL